MEIITGKKFLEMFDERIEKADKENISHFVIKHNGKTFACVLYDNAKIFCPFLSKNAEINNFENIEIDKKDLNNN